MGRPPAPGAPPAPPPAPPAPTTTLPADAPDIFIAHSLSFSQDFPDDATEASLKSDVTLMSALTRSLVDGVGKAIPELDGQLYLSSIKIEKLSLSAARRLSTGESRRLAVKKLTVDYSIFVPPGVSTYEALSSKLVSNKAKLESEVTSSYKKAYEYNTGSPPKGFTGVQASATTSKKSLKATTEAPTTTTIASTEAPTTAPDPATTTPASTTTPAPADKQESVANFGRSAHPSYAVLLVAFFMMSFDLPRRSIA